jgi:hypothetical protein
MPDRLDALEDMMNIVQPNTEVLNRALFCLRKSLNIDSVFRHYRHGPRIWRGESVCDEGEINQKLIV